MCLTTLALILTCKKTIFHFFNLTEIFSFSDRYNFMKVISLPEVNPTAIWLAISLKFAFLAASSRAETDIIFFCYNANLSFSHFCHYA